MPPGSEPPDAREPRDALPPEPLSTPEPFPSDAREPRPPWQGKRVVLGVSGGIAAYKSVQAARDLTVFGATVDVVLTPAATEFVAPLSFAGVTGREPCRSTFGIGADGALHMDLARKADCVCVAPATADLLARAASGQADDLLAAVLLATRAPVLVAPAMNDAMFAHPQTQANLSRLENVFGYRRVGPVAGRLAAGEGSGAGRMVEPSVVVQAVGRALAGDSALAGVHVLVTAGPTWEPLDPVRYFGNRSSGKMGYALAAAAWQRGAEVTLVSGPSGEEPPWGVELVRVETALEMREAVLDRAGGAAVAVHAAAVSDYRPRQVLSEKIRKSETGSGMDVPVVSNPDIATESRRRMPPGGVSVGFALETSDVVARAKAKLANKGFDFIVANRAGVEGEGFGADTNRAFIVEPDNAPRELPLMPKDALAGRIMELIEGRLAG